MEYVVIVYGTQRDVLIDEQVAGKTGDTLMVETGHHRFTLSGPLDYSPPELEKLVEKTTSISPLRIEDFKPR